VQDLWRPRGDRDLREAVKAENQAAVSKSVSKSPAARGAEGSDLAAAYRNRTDDLRITRVFPCVARGCKTRR
jgi:hypothetical protein